jgi:hypothetical protein
MKRRAEEGVDLPIFIYRSDRGEQRVKIIREIDATLVEVQTEEGFHIQVPRNSLERDNPRREQTRRNVREAIRENDEGLFQYYLQNEVVNPSDFVLAAVTQGRNQILRMLLDRGANPNARNSGGISALRFCSAVTCNVRCVRMLVDAGARDDQALVGATQTALSSLEIDEDPRMEELFRNALEIIKILKPNSSTLDECRALVRSSGVQGEKLSQLEEALE